MIVRNLLVMAPFGAVLAARGLRAVWDAAGRSHPKAVGGAIVCAATIAVTVNVAFDLSAVDSIRRRAPERTLSEFGAWLDAQPPGSVQLSERLQHAIGAPRAPAPRSSDDPSTYSDVAMYALDSGHDGIRPNGPRLFKQVFGPREVNLDYYPDWVGDEHIVVLSRPDAVRFGIVAP
jgi:hypothetical protein